MAQVILPQPGDLTDLFQVETFRGLPTGNIDEALLQIFISSVSSRISQILSRNFTYVVLPDWVAGTYASGFLIKPSLNNAGGFTYQCSVAGVTNGSAPALWPQTVTNTVGDGGVTWLNVGAGVNVTELRNGHGQREMMLRLYPVNVLGSVGLGGTPQVAAVNDSTDGWLLDVVGVQRRGVVSLRGISAWSTGGGYASFGGGSSKIRINYGYGYWTPGQAVLLSGGTADQPAAPPSGVQVLPYDLKEAVTEIVALRYIQKDRWGDTGMGMGPERVNYFLKEMHDSSQQALMAYQDKVPIWD